MRERHAHLYMIITYMQLKRQSMKTIKAVEVMPIDEDVDVLHDDGVDGPLMTELS